MDNVGWFSVTPEAVALHQAGPGLPRGSASPPQWSHGSQARAVCQSNDLNSGSMSSGTVLGLLSAASQRSGVPSETTPMLVGHSVHACAVRGPPLTRAGTLGAERAAGAGLAVDAFCGVGGNAVHLARRCARVLGLDHSAARLALAAHNAGVYGVAQYLDLACCDFRTALPRLQARAPHCMHVTECILHGMAIMPG